MVDILNENISHEDLKKYLQEFYNYACKRHKIGSKPRLFLRKDETNAGDFLGKTGYYDPNNREIHIFIVNRHPKDIVRSLSHELIHHKQNLEGRFSGNMGDTSKDGYALEDGPLRDLEKEAFTEGDLTFRDWTDLKKIQRKDTMKEEKEQPPFEGGEEKDKLSGKGKAKKLAVRARKAMEKKASAQAKEDMKTRLGKDERDEGLPDNLNENNNNEEDKEVKHPYPQLFAEKERLLKDIFNKKEELVYQELLKRIIKK
jgi:hypothetical protein